MGLNFVFLGGGEVTDAGMSEETMQGAAAAEKTRGLADPAKWFWAVIGLLVVVLVSLVAWIFVYDEPVADISDLQEKYGQPLPTNARGQAWGKFVESLPGIVNFEEIDPQLEFNRGFDPFALRHDDPLLKEYFERNRVTLERTLAVLQGKEVLAETTEPEPATRQIMSSTGFRMTALAYLLVHYAQSEAEQGRIEEVLPLLEAFTVLNHCWLLRSNAGREEKVTIMAADLFVITALQKLVGHLDSRDACLREIKAWEQLEFSGEDFKRIFFHEMLVFRELMPRQLDVYVSEKPIECLRPLTLKPGATVNLFERVFREQTAQDWNAGRLQPAATRKQLEQELAAASWRRFLVPNYYGKAAVVSFRPDFGLVVRSANNARSRLLRTGLALRAYWLEHDQTLPPDLAALVPEYLPELPLDPFSGKPICYDQQRQRIWLVQNDEEMQLDWPRRKTEAGVSSHE